MPGKNLHDKAFNESTLAKLGIFEEYIEEWLPVFITKGISPIHIFDFFAGTGYDKNGVAGSAIRILEKIKRQINLILRNRVKIAVHLNEYEPERKSQIKYALLKDAVDDYLTENRDVANAIDVEIYNRDFDKLFPILLPSIKAFASLVFLDQNGIRFLSDSYLSEFANMRQTDLLYFASASYLWRFGETPEFKKHVDFDIDELKSEPYKFVHRTLVKLLRKRIPSDSRLRLYPFSLQKGANIYGVIFGASHPLAFDKFVDIGWRINNVNGEANFDIDDDSSKVQGKLFEPNLTKKESFQKLLREKVLTGEIEDNKRAYDFSLEEGHPAKQANDTLSALKKAGEITFENRSPLVNYAQVYRKRRLQRFAILKK